MVKIRIRVNIRIIFLFSTGSIGYEVISIISTSKIKNRRATVKNCRENGVDGEFITVSPHSNCVQGAFFCFVVFFVFCRMRRKSMVISIEVVQMMEIFIILLAF